ncbi:MAG: Nif3-like dinuclear metal center hexameric protein [archaeon]
MPRLSTLKQFLDDLYGTPDYKFTKKSASISAEKPRAITHGTSYVKKIALCVNATNETIKEAMKRKADIIIAHNSEFLDEKSTEEKQKILKDNQITLYVTGQSMDTLYVYGTDYILAKAMGLKVPQVLDTKTGRGLFGSSRISTYEMFLRRINWLTHEASESYKNSSDTIRKAAIYAGETPKEAILELASKNGCNALLANTADISLKTAAKDMGISLFIANYTATERMSLVALKKIIDDRFTTTAFILKETDY